MTAIKVLCVRVPYSLFTEWVMSCDIKNYNQRICDLIAADTDYIESENGLATLQEQEKELQDQKTEIMEKLLHTRIAIQNQKAKMEKDEAERIENAKMLVKSLRAAQE